MPPSSKPCDSAAPAPAREAAAPAGRAGARAIAVGIDDTLNDFTATLRGIPFPYDPAFGLSEEAFARHLGAIRRDEAEPGELLSTEYSYLRYNVHEACYRAARPLDGAAAFLRRLAERRWRIVLCTRRDLRRASGITRAWLGEHGIPFDHLFMAMNKVAFCRAWGIAHLVDHDPFNRAHGGAHGVEVYFPATAADPAAPAARPYASFEELLRWIPD